MITLWRARELLIMDKRLLGSGGSSDPLVRFRVSADQTATSSTKKRTCNPDWGGETWTLKADSPDGVLEVIVDDWDQVTSWLWPPGRLWLACPVSRIGSLR